VVRSFTRGSMNGVRSYVTLFVERGDKRETQSARRRRRIAATIGRKTPTARRPLTPSEGVTDRIEVKSTIAAPADDVFAVLCDPAGAKSRSTPPACPDAEGEW